MIVPRSLRACSPRPGRAATGEPPDGERTIGVALLGLVVVTVAFDAGRACPPGIPVTLPAGGDRRKQHVRGPDAVRRFVTFGAPEGTMGSMVEAAMGEPARRDAGRNHRGELLAARVLEGRPHPLDQ